MDKLVSCCEENQNSTRERWISNNSTTRDTNTPRTQTWKHCETGRNSYVKKWNINISYQYCFNKWTFIELLCTRCLLRIWVCSLWFSGYTFKKTYLLSITTRLLIKVNVVSFRLSLKNECATQRHQVCKYFNFTRWNTKTVWFRACSICLQIIEKKLTYS